MGLSNFPTSADGVLPILVINTVHSVILLKAMFRFMLQLLGGTTTTTTSTSSNMEQEEYYYSDHEISSSREKRVSITHYKSLCDNNSIAMTECCCCVCLSRFEANEEVSELPCKHFFHRGCLDKWFDNKHTTCPLCRSVD
ncbi:unnamed protein product [Lupinus luteus]|uniref:RING-type domain-containing protein n=1 Tax=Lupinus luteus TaxID=3873 RepID=A0AAV1YGE4_LUPLU